MKPTSPEEREIEQARAEVSARYREAANDEPSASLDAAILRAAREEAARGGVRRNWRVPAAVAAVLVLGVSLSFMTREVVDPLPPLEQRRGADQARNEPAQAEMAKPASPGLAMKPDAAPEAKQKQGFDSRPSRERGERDDREAGARHGPASDKADAATGQSASDVATGIAPPAPPAAAPAGAVPDATLSSRGNAPAPAESALQDKARERETPAADALAKKAAPAEEMRRLQSPRKEEAAGIASGNVVPEIAAPPTAEAWVRQIEALVAQGRQAEAKARLVEFRRRHPDFRLPEALRKLEAEPGGTP